MRGEVLQTRTHLDRPRRDSSGSRQNDRVADDQRQRHLAQVEQRRERAMFAEYDDDRQWDGRCQPDARCRPEGLAISYSVDESAV